MTHRFVATTYNIWARTRWPERERALESYLRVACPDILCVQELRPESRALIDATLEGHSRIDDEFVGWAEEGNIYFTDSLFSHIEHGGEDVGQESPNRRLFWARLLHEPSSRTILVATIHLTHQQKERELIEGISPRIGEIRNCISQLERLSEEGEPLLLMGDMNDSINVMTHLYRTGYDDSFTSSGSPYAPTHPVRPTAEGIPQVFDWQFHRGPVRSLGSYVGDYFLDDMAPSDHRPVSTTYGLD